MFQNQSVLSREEQLKLWKEKKLEEKKKAKIGSQRASPSPSYSTGKSLMTHTHATRSQSTRTGPLTCRNPNTTRALDQRCSKSHHGAHALSVAVKEIEVPTNRNADSPFRNDMVSPLASICQSSPHEEASVPPSTDSRDIQDCAEIKDISKCNRRRRTDFSTLLLPIPSLREHMTQSTTSPATEQGQERSSPAFSLSSQRAPVTKRSSPQDERSALMTPESVTHDSKNSSNDPKTERLMGIDEDNCITEWEDQDISPPAVRSRRRTDSLGLLLPIPSLRNTLTPPEHNTSLKHENPSPTCENSVIHEIGSVPIAAPSLSPLEDGSRRRRDRSRRSTGDLRNSRRYGSPTLLLPIPSLREEWTPNNDGTTMHRTSTPVCDDLSHQELEQSAPIEPSYVQVSENARFMPCDASNPVTHMSKSNSILPMAPSCRSLISGENMHADGSELQAIDGRESGCVAIERVETFLEKDFFGEDTRDMFSDSCKVSCLPESEEGMDRHSANRSLGEEYREPAKLNGRTVLLSISEESFKQNSDEIKWLRGQVEQLSVTNKLLTGRLHKFRHDYEERVTPFRDLFEQNAKLREENKKLLLLKAENNILKLQNKEIMEGVSMLEGQTMLAIQKALERQKTLEEEREKAFRRAADLERQVQELLAR